MNLLYIGLNNMKLLILTLLISFNVLADVKVTVTDSKGRISCGDGCPFKTQLESDAWIADNISNDSWGKEGTYSIETFDITAEVEAEKAAKEADKLKIDELKAKDKAMKLEELIELLKLKGVI